MTHSLELHLPTRHAWGRPGLTSLCRSQGWESHPCHGHVHLCNNRRGLGVGRFRYPARGWCFQVLDLLCKTWNKNSLIHTSTEETVKQKKEGRKRDGERKGRRKEGREKEGQITFQTAVSQKVKTFTVPIDYSLGLCFIGFWDRKSLVTRGIIWVVLTDTDSPPTMHLFLTICTPTYTQGIRG